MATQPITVLLCALGGEGGGVLSEWLYTAALHAGHSAQCTSIPGVAQRTGATTYYVELWPEPDALLGGARPVFSLNPVPGAIDLLVSSELLETARQVGAGMASAERSRVISANDRALTVAEKMSLGDGRLDSDALQALVRANARDCTLLDMAALAAKAGTVISAVMLGAIAGSGALPLPRAAFEAAIAQGGRGVAASLRGFALGFDAARAALPAAVAPAATAASAALPADLAQRFPIALHEMLALGHARVLDYQDAAYAALYVQRIETLLAAERHIDPIGKHGCGATREAARWLALWMAFDDIVRVAALKLRASRGARVRREVAARDDEIVKVYEHFKPGVAELAALLPSALAQRALAWDARRVRQGREPWAMPLKLGSHTITGACALRLLAGLKGQRRRGSRYATEQALIERWLTATTSGLQEHWALGHELAQCGRLIKGYGSTNERGKRNLLHIVDHLADAALLPDARARAAAIRDARQAALADEAGSGLDRALQQHGAPPRPVPEQPIRWHRRATPSTPVSH